MLNKALNMHNSPSSHIDGFRAIKLPIAVTSQCVHIAYRWDEFVTKISSNSESYFKG